MPLVIVEDNKTNLMILCRLAERVEDCEVSAFCEPEIALASVIKDG